MGTLEKLRIECEQKYSDFARNKLVFKSQEFGKYIKTNAVMPETDSMRLGCTHCSSVLEIREISSQYRVGCVQWVRFVKGEKEGEWKFKWFDMYNNILTTVEEGIRFCRFFVFEYDDAENEHLQAGIEHYVGEIRRGIR